MYHSFGMNMPGRTYSAGSAYRYGFNGKENSPEITKGAISFEARIYDGRIGRFFSTDPREREYAWQSTYVYFSNCPTSVLDILGMGDDKRKADKGVYTVQEDGESLKDIAGDFNTSRANIKRISENSNVNWKNLKKGDKIRVEREAIATFVVDGSLLTSLDKMSSSGGATEIVGFTMTGKFDIQKKSGRVGITLNKNLASMHLTIEGDNVTIIGDSKILDNYPQVAQLLGLLVNPENKNAYLVPGINQFLSSEINSSANHNYDLITKNHLAGDYYNRTKKQVRNAYLNAEFSNNPLVQEFVKSFGLDRLSYSTQTYNGFWSDLLWGATPDPKTVTIKNDGLTISQNINIPIVYHKLGVTIEYIE